MNQKNCVSMTNGSASRPRLNTNIFLTGNPKKLQKRCPSIDLEENDEENQRLAGLTNISKVPGVLNFLACINHKEKESKIDLPCEFVRILIVVATRKALALERSFNSMKNSEIS